MEFKQLNESITKNFNSKWSRDINGYFSIENVQIVQGCMKIKSSETCKSMPQ